MSEGDVQTRIPVETSRRTAAVCSWFLLRLAALLMCGACWQVAVAKEYPNPNLDEIRAMNACGSRYLQANRPDAIIPVLQQKQLVEPFKAALLRVTTPYSPNRAVIQNLDQKVHEAVGSLLFLTSVEALRAHAMVDLTPFNANHYVLMYYMAQAAGVEGGPDCSLSPLIQEWMDGMAFSEFERRPDVNGVPFALLDFQQMELAACSYKAAGQTRMDGQALAKFITADAKRTQEFESAAFVALASSPHVGELNGLDRVPDELYQKSGLTDKAERRAYSFIATLYAASVDDRDYVTRLKARSLLEYYHALVSPTSCPLPQESKQLIESLHVDH